jgi:hypothetical protein
VTKKAFFFDLDGTLAEHNLPASMQDVEAIRAVRARGHSVFLCTGRTPCHIYDSILDIGFDGIIAGGGTHITLGGNMIYRKEIDPFIIGRIIELFTTYGGFCILEGEQSLYVINPGNNNWGCDWHKISDPDVFVPHKGEFAGQAVLKFSADAQSCRPFSDKFYADFNIIDHGGFLEFVPQGNSKSAGMRRVLDAVGIDYKDSVAFGDSPNDLDMLQFAGIGVAMGNATQAVKSAADEITAPLSESGVSLTLNKYLTS